MSRLPPVTTAMRSAYPSLITHHPTRISGLPDHLLRPHPRIELLLAEIAELQCRRLQRGAVLVRLLGDRGGLLVADMRIQRRHQHQRLAHQLLDARAVGLDADSAVLVKIFARTREEFRAVEEIADDERTEHIELEVTGRAAD